MTSISVTRKRDTDMQYIEEAGKIAIPQICHFVTISTVSATWSVAASALTDAWNFSEVLPRLQDASNGRHDFPGVAGFPYIFIRMRGGSPIPLSRTV